MCISAIFSRTSFSPIVRSRFLSASIGEKLVREKIADIHKVWEVLKHDFPKYEIYKLIHYETEQGEHPNWKLTEMFMNVNGKVKKMIDDKL